MPNDTPEWLLEIAWSVHELIGSDEEMLDHIREMVRQGSREISEFYEQNPRMEGEGDERRWKEDDEDRYGIGPLQIGKVDTPAKKVTVLAAVHDHCLDDIMRRDMEPVEAINPWRKQGVSGDDEDKLAAAYLTILIEKIPDLQEENAETLRNWLDDVKRGEVGFQAMNRGTPDGDDGEAEAQYVTLDQAAALVSRHKDTIGRWIRKDPKAPTPAVEGGGGKPHEFLWTELRPWLEEKSGRSLPETVPGHIFSADRR